MPGATASRADRIVLLLGAGSSLALAAVAVLSAVTVLLLLGGKQLADLQACDSSSSELARPVGASAIGRASIPPRFIALYVAAATRYGLGADGWLWLAAIHEVETDFGRNARTSSAGAQGPMQFMPDTWRRYGVDADHDGRADTQNTADAIYGAANYLHASGAPADWHRAVFAYNHAEWYYQRVLSFQASYRGGHADPSPDTPKRARTAMASLPAATAADPAEAGASGVDSAIKPAPGSGCAAPDAVQAAEISVTAGARARLTPLGQAVAPQEAPVQVKAILAAGNQIAGRPYTYGGGHGPPLTSPVASYDCSSSISYILLHAGLFDGTAAWVSGAFAQSYGLAGPGRWVTLRANAGHIYMYVAGLRWDTHRYGPADAGVPGIGWHTAQRPDTGFTARHPPAL